MLVEKQDGGLALERLDGKEPAQTGLNFIANYLINWNMIGLGRKLPNMGLLDPEIFHLLKQRAAADAQ